MKVSIITTCYNSESTILGTIKSVKEQTYKNIEHIIIDGNSSDNTIDIINNNLNSKMKVISEPDDGCYDAFNKGLIKVRVKLLVFYILMMCFIQILLSKKCVKKLVMHLEYMEI